MADHRLNEFLSFVNQQLETNESVSEHITKSRALVQVALTNDFSEHPAQVVHAYLWALDDILEKMQEMNADSLENIFKNQKSLIRFSVES